MFIEKGDKRRCERFLRREEAKKAESMTGVERVDGYGGGKKTRCIYILLTACKTIADGMILTLDEDL